MDGYWERLVDNGVEVVDGWTEAERFSGASDGPKPLVVSCRAARHIGVLFAPTPVDEAPTDVVTETCFRQVEFAEVLRGTDAPTRRAVSSTSWSARFQSEIALNLFVYPVLAGVELPAEFTDTIIPDDPHARSSDDRRAPRVLDRDMDGGGPR